MAETIEKIRGCVEQGSAILGVEFGSTRIKAVLIDDDKNVIAQGNHDWENKLVDGVWTYDIEDVWAGLADAYAKLKEDVKSRYSVVITKLRAVGISAMMHGYMAFDADELSKIAERPAKTLVPFRTWRNNITAQSSDELSTDFNFNIPERYSISHFYQAVLNGEEHVKKVAHFNTLAGYVSFCLTGEISLGVGDASGMFPIDSATNDYDEKLINIFDEKLKEKGIFEGDVSVLDLLPKVLNAGEVAGKITPAGANLLDRDGDLESGSPVCPAEGDAGTGMVATNAVREKTGNISAGTSVFAMLVLKNPLKKLHRDIDNVTTPDGKQVAMVHANNCTSDLNAWVGIFREFANSMGHEISDNELYGLLYNKALEGDKDCGNLLSYGYISGENITGIVNGRPLFVRKPDSNFNLANFMRAHLYTALAAIRIGMNTLREEGTEIESVVGHGGLFKTKGVGDRIVAAAMESPITVMETAGEGGAYGIAILADYMCEKEDGESLADFLDNKVFNGAKSTTTNPDPEDVLGFTSYVESYVKGLPIEKASEEW